MKSDQKQIIEGLTSRLVLNVIRDFKLAPGAALDVVFGSDVFAQICDIRTGRYQDGTVCLYSDLKSEITKGSFFPEF